MVWEFVIGFVVLVAASYVGTTMALRGFFGRERYVPDLERGAEGGSGSGESRADGSHGTGESHVTDGSYGTDESHGTDDPDGSQD